MKRLLRFVGILYDVPASFSEIPAHLSLELSEAMENWVKANEDEMFSKDDMNGRHQSYFVFREAANTDELLELSQLRYRVYQDSRLSRFVPENKYGIDLDCCDVRAQHFGLLALCAGTEQSVGHCRVVEDREVSGKTDVLEFVRQIPGLNRRVAPWTILELF